MNINMVKPYMIRLKRRNNDITAKIFAHKDTIVNDFQQMQYDGNPLFSDVSIFNSTEVLPQNNLLAFIEFKNVNVATLPDAWDSLATNGWLFIRDTEHNMKEVKEFRRVNRITSLLSRVDGVIYFQKEDYSKRNPMQGAKVAEIDQTLIRDDWEVLTVPDWNESHMKLEFIEKYGSGTVFIETGTYLGQTVEMMRRSVRPVYERIVSIEINHELAEKAKKIFDYDNRIEIIEGDSVEVMQDLCANLKEPATFWLDAHASGPLPGGKYGPAPLIQELEAIAATGIKDHAIFIDDRRLMGSKEWGGLTEAEIMAAALRVFDGNVEVRYLDGEIPLDVICLSPHNRELETVQEDQNTLPQGIREYFHLDRYDAPKSKPLDKPKIVFLEV